MSRAGGRRPTGHTTPSGIVALKPVNKGLGMIYADKNRKTV
ncbi:MAG: hypothetical protein ACLQVX_20050 [Limisphaerales bacterium]